MAKTQFRCYVFKTMLINEQYVNLHGPAAGSRKQCVGFSSEEFNVKICSDCRQICLFKTMINILNLFILNIPKLFENISVPATALISTYMKTNVCKYFACLSGCLFVCIQKRQNG